MPKREPNIENLIEKRILAYFGEIMRGMLKRGSKQFVFELYKKGNRNVERTSRWWRAFEGDALKVILDSLRMAIKHVFKNRTQLFEASVFN
ncbi:hypothetical protein HanIR_Chr08g0362491 [Helianthus annuus]|nr:hypothetical protein HanIR_Chr08g0362491 [Helianthus annuus]